MHLRTIYSLWHDHAKGLGWSWVPETCPTTDIFLEMGEVGDSNFKKMAT